MILIRKRQLNRLLAAIHAGGHECEFLEADISLYDTVRKYKPDICFNISEGHFGDAREAQVPCYPGNASCPLYRLQGIDACLVLWTSP